MIAFVHAVQKEHPLRCVLVPAPGQAFWFNEHGEIIHRDEKDARLPWAKPDVGMVIRRAKP